MVETVSVRAIPRPTKRLRFREYQPEDLQAVATMFDDPEARQWYSTHSEQAEPRRWIE
jgi:RimJ/RimL family protein N-acetyltransferase